jgi:hypothetical protein
LFFWFECHKFEQQLKDVKPCFGTPGTGLKTKNVSTFKPYNPSFKPPLLPDVFWIFQSDKGIRQRHWCFPVRLRNGSQTEKT